MKRLFPLLLPLVVLLLTLVLPDASAQPVAGVVRGEVFDGSGGLVPGVTVDALASGHVVGTTVTDARGSFVLGAVPAGAVTITWTLDGFDSAPVGLLVQPGAEFWVSGQLRVAAVSERVVVRADGPRESPRVEAPRRRPAPVIRPVPLPDMESVCGPAKPGVTPEIAGTLQSHRHEANRILYRKGDEVTITAGAGVALAVGQNFVARRYFRAAGSRGTAARGEHTAGVVQVVSASEAVTTAVVIHACGELRQGDWLAPFVPVMPAAEPVGLPVYGDAARILFGDAGQLMGAAGRLMVIDRGQAHGVRAGQRMTLFRRSRHGRNVVLGQALVLAVREDSARIRVEHANDAIWSGDSAAPQEPPVALSTLRGQP